MSAAAVSPLHLPPDTFFALYDGVAREFDDSRPGRRRAAILSALTYHGQVWGLTFKWKLADIERTMRSTSKRRSIITGLQELAAAGFITSRSDGSGLIISILEKCVFAHQKCKFALQHKENTRAVLKQEVKKRIFLGTSTTTAAKAVVFPTKAKPENETWNLEQPPKPAEQHAAVSTMLSADQRAARDLLTDRFVSARAANNLARKHPPARIRRNVVLFDQGDHSPGWLRNAVIEDYASNQRRQPPRAIQRAEPPPPLFRIEAGPGESFEEYRQRTGEPNTDDAAYERWLAGGDHAAR